jgi:hypothetical protein
LSAIVRYFLNPYALIARRKYPTLAGKTDNTDAENKPACGGKICEIYEGPTARASQGR